MELEQAIAQRRSVRKYENKPVEREKINACLEAARLAPSACNSQPWHFVVLDDPQIKDAFCKEAFSGVYAMTKWAAAAPVIIAVVSDAGNFTARIGNFFRRTEFYLVDQGIACEHLVLRAHDLGLGTCWIGWLIGRISLTFMADVKFIRNKLYELDNSYLGVFLANRTSVAPPSSAAAEEGGFDYAAVAQQLMQLKALLDDGTITKEEFDREKAKLLKN